MEFIEYLQPKARAFADFPPAQRSTLKGSEAPSAPRKDVNIALLGIDVGASTSV